MNNLWLKFAARALGSSALFFSLGLLSLTALSPSAHAQASSNPGVQVFSSKRMDQQFAILKAKNKAAGGGGDTLGDYGSHKILLSVRTESGGAEMHQHFDDIIIVKQGHATIVTGGTIVDAKTSPDGETKGSRIEGGVSHSIQPGDIVHIPAGTPHQLMLQAGNSFSAAVVKVKE